MDEHDLTELTDNIWENHQDELGRKTIGIDLDLKTVVRIIIQEYDEWRTQQNR